MSDPFSHSIVFYDGVCGLCNRLVQFLLKHDHQDRLRFASLQSGFAARLLQKHNLDPTDLDTVYVVVNGGTEDEQVLARSEAIMYLFNVLGGVWKVLMLGKILPRALRDIFYRLVASNRYRVFGQSESCIMPEPRHREKFIEV